MKAWLAALGLGAVVASGAAALRAQEQTLVHVVEDRKVCSVHVVPCWGASGGYGLTFALVEVENHDSQQHQLQVKVASHPWSSSDVSMQRAIPLGPEERARFFLPLPSRSTSCSLFVVIDNVPMASSLNPVGNGDGLCGLLIADRSEALPHGMGVLQAIPTSSSVAPVQVQCRGGDLPADWRLFTGFHAVVVEGRTRIDADVQEALRRFVFGGGTLVVEAAERMPAGALRDLCLGATGDDLVVHGLGRCCVVPPFGGDTSVMRTRLARLPKASQGIWPAPGAWFGEQPVPGLGRAPVLAFLLVILLFAALVGPVNFVVLRRLRRPMLALVTVPVLGLSTTAVMLGYGFLHDGFGTRGVVSSWTLLDQERHECVVIAARTLFAGLSPGSCTMGPDSMLLSARAFFRRERRGADRWHLGEDGALDAGILPSRITTPLLTAQQGTVRQRLRARQVGDAELHLLTDGGCEPTGEVVLRDLEGAWWIGSSPVLQRVAASQAQGALLRVTLRAGVMRVLEHDVERTQSLADLVARAMGEKGMEPGHYVMQVASAPWLDEHGLSVAYDAQAHFVFGRMQAQDFVR